MVKKSTYYTLLNELLFRNHRNYMGFSDIHIMIKPLSTFSANNLKLPLQIQGRLITANEYNDLANGKIKIEPEELQKTTSLWKNINIFKSHKTYQDINNGGDPNIDDVVGRIVKTFWNVKEKAIDFVAEIYDKSVALKMLNGLIRFVSVGFHRDIIQEKDVNFVKNIEPAEVSLVFNPRDPSAKFKPIINQNA